jgi:hypothetical protein
LGDTWPKPEPISMGFISSAFVRPVRAWFITVGRVSLAYLRKQKTGPLAPLARNVDIIPGVELTHDAHVPVK